MIITFDINEFATMPSTEPFGRGGLKLRDSLVAQYKIRNFNNSKKPLDLNNFQIQWELCNSLDELKVAPALYKLTMPNNIIYIGQSGNVRKRIIEHIFKIMYNKERSYVDAKWYYKVHQQFNYKDLLLDYFNEIFTNLKIEIFYLSSGYEAMRVEKIVLEKIWKEGRRDFYYNSQFYKTNDKGVTKLIRYANPNCE